MSRVGRLAGALLAESGSDHFLIGNLKRPCDFAAAGFERPAAEIDALARPWVRLQRSGPLAGSVPLPGPWLELSLEGEPLLRALADRLLIERNGAVSDRLWRLILSADPDADLPGPDVVVDARWLGEMPAHLWQIVREAVLRCT
jgi:hypothetical protein